MTVVVTHSTPSDSSFSASGAVAWDASHTLAGVGTMAGQDANTVAITGGAIDGTTVGNGTPAAGTFTTLIGGADAANYGQLTGGATTKAVQFRTLGTDTNISMALQPKGTGAIDLASNVNISNGGTVTAITRTAGGTTYATAPTVAISAPTTAGGVQATATCTVTAGVVDTTFTITAAGSGYVEQPTVTFSGGGGSGAAAYATVGSGTVVKNLGSTLSFTTPSGEAFRVADGATTATVNFWTAFNSSSTPFLRGNGTTANGIDSSSTAPIVFRTNGGSFLEQLRVSHTASAVNYVQVTGGASGAPGVVTMSAQGSSTDVDIAVTPKGAGVVKFATYTAGIIAQAGYITIKDSGGTVRRLLVG